MGFPIDDCISSKLKCLAKPSCGVNSAVDRPTVSFEIALSFSKLFLCEVGSILIPFIPFVAARRNFREGPTKLLPLSPFHQYVND